MWRYRHILALQKIAIYGEAHVFPPAADFRSPLIFAFDRPSTESFLDQLSMTFVRFETAAVLGTPHSGLIVIYVKRVSAAVQLDSKARATRIRAEISPPRAIASAV
jgi:hypothetical protein